MILYYLNEEARHRMNDQVFAFRSTRSWNLWDRHKVYQNLIDLDFPEVDFALGQC